jgi:hypothetical protein
MAKSQYHAPAPLPVEKKQYSLNRRLGEPQSMPECFAEYKNLVHLQGFEFRTAESVA